MGTEIKLDEYRKKKKLEDKIKESRRKKQTAMKQKAKKRKTWIWMGIVLGILYFLFIHPNAYEIYYDHKSMGIYKKDREAVSRMFELARLSKKQELGVIDVKPLHTYAIKPVHASRSQWINPDMIVSNLKNAMQVQVHAAVVLVDGKVKMILGNTEKAKGILEEYKEAYKTKEKRKGKAVFQENVKILEQFVDPKQIMDEKKVQGILSQGTAYEDVYYVQKGDTFAGIEEKFNMGYGTLKDLNPDSNPNKVKVGDKLKVSVHKPFLTVIIQ